MSMMSVSICLSVCDVCALWSRCDGSRIPLHAWIDGLKSTLLFHSKSVVGYHRRRRSRASPVLTAISLVNGKPWEPSFLTPTKSIYLNRSLKNLSQVIRSMTSTAVQNLVEIRPWGASGQIGEILTIFRLLFIPLF